MPHQVSIIGYDNVEYAAAASTPLPSVNCPAELVAGQAASLILGLVDGPERQEVTRIVIEPGLLRNNTAPAIEVAPCEPEGSRRARGATSPTVRRPPVD